jgi:DNA-binding beta-propeller fold protein YncE
MVRRRPDRRVIRGIARAVAVLGLVPLLAGTGYPQGQNTLPVKKLFQIQGTPERPFRQPTDVAVDSRGRIVVLDGLNSRVAVFDANGNHLLDFGSPGSGPGQMRMPVGLGVSRSDELFVADSGNHRIQVFSSSGKLLRTFPLKNGEKADPTDVMPLALKNSVYVVDNDNHQIQVYNAATGAYMTGWGGHGKNLGEFRYPATIAADPDNNVFVVDVMNARVQTFDPLGNDAREIGGWGVNPGKLFRPKGVAVDPKGRIYVSDSYMEIVQVFDHRGTFLGILGDGGAKLERFRTPTNIVVDSRGRLYVAETRADRISVYQVLQ